MTKESDIVLIYFEDKPLSFARIENILPDSKPNWYHVKLLLLQIPLQVVTWILREAYINGDEFTMNGKRMRLELVVAPESPKETHQAESKTKPSKNTGKAKVISLSDLKKS